MNKKVIQIDEEKCIGCGLCANTCQQDVIKIIDGKAKVIKDDYCDGIGNCLPVCPVDAISFSDKDVVAKHSLQNTQWPLQIKLVLPQAHFFENADLLVAADCTAFAYANFHLDFMKNKITIIGCPKLDAVDYKDKLTEIFKTNNIKSITTLRMQVPCCFGIESAVKKAIEESKKSISHQVFVISTTGEIIK